MRRVFSGTFPELVRHQHLGSFMQREHKERMRIKKDEVEILNWFRGFCQHTLRAAYQEVQGGPGAKERNAKADGAAAVNAGGIGGALPGKQRASV
jgi:hypothetical protein